MISQFTNTFFPISSLAISIFLCILYFGRKNVKNKETKLYSLLVICGLVESTYYVCLTFGVDLIYKDYMYGIFQYLNKVLGIIYLVWITLLFYYVVSIISENKNIIIKNCLIFLTCIFSIIILVLPIEVWWDPQKYVSNSYGPSLNFLYVIFLIYIFIMFIIVIVNNKRKNLKGKFIPLYTLFLLIIISLIVRAFDPLFNITSNILSLVLLVMYHTIENPDVKMINKLELAKNEAEKANRAKSDFLSSMSHEIRTPLNAIVGFSEMIKSSDNIEEIHEDAEDVINASHTLLEIVNGILDISKIESGKLEIINSPYNAKELFMEVANLMKPKIQEKALDFQISISEDLPNTLYGDHSNIKKVITNILSNAYKYTDKGFIKYTVSCINDKDISRIVISVEDSGRGIKKENIDKLFTKFQRLEEDKNTTIEGTGLGLAITKQIVELMGGKVIVQSVYGSGSKFTIILDQRIEKTEVKEEEKKIDIDINIPDKKILLVDDNLLNLKVATKFLEKYHPIVESVDSGFLCLDKINSGNKYDLILLDDMMPKMSGVETLKKLKQISGFNTPCVALTANAITGMREKYLSEGFDNYLAKPINKDELKKIIIRYLVENDRTIDFGELPKEIYEIGNTSQIDIAQPVNNNIEAKKEDTNISSIEYLKENNIDIDNAINLLGDINMYNDTLKEFVDNSSNRIKKLEKYKNNKNMTDYAIEVHALKSDAKYLGFISLADIAYEHELKSKENNLDYIEANYNNLIIELNKILKIANKYLNL